MKKLIVLTMAFSTLSYPHLIYAVPPETLDVDNYELEEVLELEQDEVPVEHESSAEVSVEEPDEDVNAEMFEVESFDVEELSVEPQTAGEWLEFASSKNTSTERLEAYIQGFQLYPSDNRFISGMNSSANSLLRWATSQHQNGHFDVAIGRYEFILTSPSELDEAIRKETEVKLKFAEDERTIPSASRLVNEANSQSSSSARLSLFIDGFFLYPTDKRFEEGINSSAHSLLRWASDQHDNGRFDIAIGRYEFILSSPTLAGNIRLTTERRLAEAKLEITTGDSKPVNGESQNADLILQEAASKPTSSERLEAYIEGYHLFPSDRRFVTGINSSARSLLNWSSSQHQNSRFEVAIGRYEFILSSPVLDNHIKWESEVKLKYAQEAKLIPSISRLLDQASRETTSSGRLGLFMDGYSLYPGDKRFEDGINSTARSLLNWATSQQNAGRFDVAIGRYEYILSSPILNRNIRQETEVKLASANQAKNSPDGLLLIARNQATSTERLTLFIEGHRLYPNDKRFANGINDSARSLLNWASSQHQLERFEVAIGRYEFILSAPALHSTLRNETEVKLQFALEGNKVQTAKQLVDLANSQPTSSERLTMFIEGYGLYPNDKRFEDGINNSADSLFKWASSQHDAGNFETAIGRYEFILSAPVLNRNLRNDVQSRLTDAKIGKRTALVILNLANSQSTSSARLSLFAEGHHFYPSDNRFIEGMNASAQSLLKWASDQHQSGNFDVAIGRYVFIIETKGVSNNIKDEARSKLLLAEAGKTLDRTIITYTQASTTFNRALEIQMGLNPPPQTDKYRLAPGFVHSSLVNITERSTTTGTTTNLRTAPDSTTSSTIATSVPRGTVVVIQRQVTGNSVSGSTVWFEIRYDNQTLYVHSSLVSTSTAAVMRSSGNVRESANTNSHNFGTLSANSTVSVNRQVTGATVSGSNVWYEINFRTWRNAKESDVIPFLDPNRNDKFQHLNLSTSVGVPASELNKVLNNKGVLHGRGQAFINAARDHSVNEIYLIAHALLETGHGREQLATGVEVGRNSSGNLELVTSSNRSRLTNIRTTHNMYGIGAVDGDAHRAGAFYAYNQGWFTPDAAIIGGARFIGQSYIHNRFNQNTLYKMRWNPASPGWPQYATDMEWATKQISTIKNLYNQLDNPVLHFDIPVYR
ncbi:N-acetylglucosaminidase [Bacillus alkalicellulosilyticus]|uniref:N-acetylglucosaminidase n=1 Tax=Alkalihalobacterium alkalicellulosilyticum TaxID=1912214 RepID=UPI000998E440|nr:N-acetylglucosaminidase [Bacillus alkalicellulosilyticus]